MIIRFSVVFAAVFLSGGCGSLPVDAPEAASEGRGPTEGAQEAAALSVAMLQAASAGADYNICPTDLVNVTVYEAPEMDRTARVNANGVIFLPLVGAVSIGGKTLGEAQKLIERRLSAYVVNPQVSLFIQEYGNKQIFVLGEVQRPGSYPIPTESRMTVLGAISTAGGFTPVAAQDRARVLRSVNGESMNYTIDVRTITRGGAGNKDMFLEPNDVIFIPQSLF